LRSLIKYTTSSLVTAWLVNMKQITVQ